jgi:hypothetical protein
VQELVLVEREEQAVADAARPASGPAESLEERGDCPGCADLDDPVQVAHVDTELQGGGRHDDAVPRLRERLLGSTAFGRGEGGVRQVGVDLAQAQRRTDLLRAPPAVHEHEQQGSSHRDGCDCRTVTGVARPLVGAIVEGLCWLTIVGAMLFVATAAYGAIKWRPDRQPSDAARVDGSSRS